MLRLFRNKTTLQAPLGRWGAVVRNTKEDNSAVRENSIDFNSNWANHDHCGREVCENKFIEHLNTKESKEKNKIKSNGDNIYKLDPLVPYCM